MTFENCPVLVCDLVKLQFPPSRDVMELAHLGSGETPPAECFLSLPSFCSSSHPRRALSGRTSMSGPRACGFEHHSPGLTRCQPSGWFCCRAESFDQRELIRARFPPSKAAVFKPQGCFHVVACVAGPGSPNGNADGEADNEVEGSFIHLLPEALQTAPAHREL